MRNFPRPLRVIVLASAAALACGQPEHAGFASDVRRELGAGRESVQSWATQSRNSALPSDDVVIGLGYLERLRLGLGSPFRLVESALRDPRLPESARSEIAWALLSRTLSGQAYEIDAAALDRAGAGANGHVPGLGRYHLEIIENAIAESRDPRGGELAVRLAYRLATMEGSLPQQAPRMAARAAALIRDREIARLDAERLLRSAEVVQGDPLRAVARWRAERHFRVEAPAMSTLPASVEREALEIAPRLAQALRSLTSRAREIDRGSPVDVSRSLLTPAVAARLAQLADSSMMPPQAPISVAARAYRQELLDRPDMSERERELRAAFADVRHEEELAARYARLSPRPGDATPALITVSAAVGLRTYGQEPVWFPGFGGPTARELEERFGLGSLRFADDVPAEWRPFYRSMLELALRDMQRVLPALDVRGLNVRFAAARRGATTLAMHDPKERTLVLPPGSAAGTIAHEVAHDLDWQVALRRYRVRGDYASDRASRLNGDRLAMRVRSLAQDAALDASLDRGSAHARRPAENFARAIDWFVASTLAAQGRTNGFLSSVQDDMLTGYGTVRPPDITGRAGNALVSILDEVAPLYPETRQLFLKSFGTTRAMNAHDLVRAISEIDLPEPQLTELALTPEGTSAVMPTFAALQQARSRAAGAIDEWVCRAPGGAHDTELERARRRLVAEATAARGRGIALQQARRMAGEAGARWVARRLYGGPWPQQELEPGTELVLTELINAAREAGNHEVRTAGPTFELMSAVRPSHCSSFVAG